MWVTLTGDANHVNDTSVMDTLTTVTFIPTKKLAIEEGTGTWCGWCVRGIVYMDSLKTLYGNNVSLIAVHNGDPMVVTAYDSWMGTKISGYPSVVVDRTTVDDPQNLLALYNNHHNDFGFADITAVGTLTGTTAVSVAVTVKPALNLNGDYRLVLVLTEDKVHGSGSTWDQHDYYSFQSQNLALTGGGVNYQDSTNPIPSASMYYEHVARSISPSVSGTAGVLPASMTAGTTYPATLTATISTSWNVNKMHGIVMLLNNANGHVLNTQNMDYASGLSNLSSGVSSVSIYPNPANDQAFLSFSLENNSKVSVEVIDMVGHVVNTIAAGELTTGTQHVAVGTENLAPGLYNVKVITETGSATQRLTVIK